MAVIDSIPIVGRFRNASATWRFFPDLWSRVLASASIVSEELDRSHVASRRYDELRMGRSTELPSRARGTKARQVFIEIYAGPPKARRRATKKAEQMGKTLR